MSQTILQAVDFQASARELFELYIDERKHTQATGAPARVSREVGGEFRAFDGHLVGTNLYLDPGRAIVQAWRAENWRKEDCDSILTLLFRDGADSGRVELVHANVPDHAYGQISDGWHRHYWQAWRAFHENETS